MYDAVIGKFFSEDPIGIDRGDPNLYRYARNDPVNYTDPSGLEPPNTTDPWQLWNSARKQLDISGVEDSRKVIQAAALIDTVFRLKDIPTLAPGTPAPAIIEVKADRSRLIRNDLFVEMRGPRASPADLARANIRANLQPLKQAIIDAVDSLLAKSPPYDALPGSWNPDSPNFLAPPVKRQLTPADRARIANKLADWYIVAVDDFLRTHPGAAPHQGARWLRTQNEKNHPWCGDWAEGMLSAAQKKNVDVEITLTFQFSNAQWNFGKLPVKGQGGMFGQRQHNWLVVYPRGYGGKDSPLGFDIQSRTGKDLVGLPLLYFDAWRNILPEVFAPAEEGYLQTDWGFEETSDK